MLTKDTELLTTEGWKRYDEVDVKKDIAIGYTISNNSLTQVKIKSIKTKNIAEPFRVFENRYISMMVSQEHNLICHISSKYREIEHTGIYDIVPAKEIRRSEVTTFLITALLDGDNTEPITDVKSLILSTVSTKKEYIQSLLSDYAKRSGKNSYTIKASPLLPITLDDIQAVCVTIGYRAYFLPDGKRMIITPEEYTTNIDFNNSKSDIEYNDITWTATYKADGLVLRRNGKVFIA